MREALASVPHRSQGALCLLRFIGILYQLFQKKTYKAVDLILPTETEGNSTFKLLTFSLVAVGYQTATVLLNINPENINPTSVSGFDKALNTTGAYLFTAGLIGGMVFGWSKLMKVLDK